MVGNKDFVGRQKTTPFYFQHFNLRDISITAGGNGPEMFDLIKNGTTSIRMTFNEAVPSGGIVLVAMGEIDSLLMLDRNRTIFTDISV
ncbi:unnamed protein product [Meloidogyne enterolobii]|uniref:Uncharacterized protein n=1 Tax=Meloidogyne enterolobii TaxID=390850 RepID=A0ACB1ALZ3_MELEN